MAKSLGGELQDATRPPSRAEDRAERIRLEIERASNLIIETMHPLTMSDTDEILLYEAGVYRIGGEAVIAAAVEREINECTNHMINEVLGHIRRRTYVKREEFDADPNILNLVNGFLDLDTFTFIDHSDKADGYRSMAQLPVTYSPQVDCPKIKRFILEVMYSDDIPTAQEYSGYTLWKGNEAQRAWLLIGDGGNGKSTFIALIKAMLGVQNISSRSLQDLEMNRFAMADLHGKLANLHPDLPDIALKSTGKFKQLTGGDPISGEHKFQNSFEFVNIAKMIFSCNKVPESPDDTTAFFRRWILTTFPNRFEGESEDKDLLAKLTTPEELNGFLNWSLEGLKRLKQNGWKFSNSKSTDKIREEYTRKSSPIQAFLMDCVTINPDGFVVKQEFFNAFGEYCRQFKLPIVSQKTFFDSLPKFAKIVTSRKTMSKGKDGKDVRAWCAVGVTLKDKPLWGKKDEEDDEGGQSKL